jgi:phosphomannomutase
VLVRPSGTEPKLKIYVDVCVNVGKEETVRGREEAAQSEARAIADALAGSLGFD